MKSLKIIALGRQLMVNIPVTICILVITFLLNGIVGFKVNVALILSVILSWKLWERLVGNWVSWLISKGVSKERIYKLGKIGLINFQRKLVFPPDEKANGNN